MPCRCCNSPKPAKGFKNQTKLEIDINLLLSNAAKLVNTKTREYDDIEDWRKGWILAFKHHIYGCPEKENYGYKIENGEKVCNFCNTPESHEYKWKCCESWRDK